jgi:hypothetical protein
MLHGVSSEVNFANILRAAFTYPNPKSEKRTDNLTVFFALLGSARVKAAHKMLVKFTPVDERRSWTSTIHSIDECRRHRDRILHHVAACSNRTAQRTSENLKIISKLNNGQWHTINAICWFSFEKLEALTC